jgi:hypothetical protein
VVISALSASEIIVRHLNLTLLVTKATEVMGVKLPETAGKLWKALQKRLSEKLSTTIFPADWEKQPNNCYLFTMMKIRLEKQLAPYDVFRNELKQRNARKSYNQMSYVVFQERGSPLTHGTKVANAGNGSMIFSAISWQDWNTQANKSKGICSKKIKRV